MTPALARPCLIALLGALLASPAATAPKTLRERVLAHVGERQPDLLREYAALLALPNLASDNEGIRRNAAHIVRLLEKRGIAARLLDGAGGPPVVYGELQVGAPKTVVLYAHYDGQPVEPERWTSPPWTPVLRDGPLGPGARTLDHRLARAVRRARSGGSSRARPPTTRLRSSRSRRRSMR